jgi:SAM-dependent methyltransferase
MIEVLQNWEEIGEATKELRRKKLPNHGLPEKNWDLTRLAAQIDPLPRDSLIIDLGCGGLHGLRFLSALGFTRLIGVDVSITLLDRAVQARRALRGRRVPFRLRRCSLLKTPFADGCADVVVALSVVEHGVDIPAFLAEASRLLRPGGALFVSTDYWPELVAKGPDLFGMPWTVLDRKQLNYLIDESARHRFRLEQSGPVPDVADRPVVWEGLEYTFVSVVFRKEGDHDV